MPASLYQHRALTPRFLPLICIMGGRGCTFPAFLIVGLFLPAWGTLLAVGRDEDAQDPCLLLLHFHKPRKRVTHF